MSRPPLNWVVYDRRSECFWGPNRGGYFKSILDAGLYTEEEAKQIQAFGERYERYEEARPLEQYRQDIERLYNALSEADTEEVCLGCGKPTMNRDCGCPAGTGVRRKSGK